VTQVRIRHAQFRYLVPYTDAEGRDRLAIRHAIRNETVDLPRDSDYRRGLDSGAFFMDEEGEPETTEPEELDFSNHTQLVRWIRDEKPNAQTVVDAADDDPFKAEALLAAEHEANGSQPRKTVVEKLEAIMEEEE
jgi:hypothetical protein